MKPVCLTLLWSLIFGLSVQLSEAAPEIGTTASIKRQVVGSIDEQKRVLKKRDAIFQNEHLQVSKNGRGEFVLKDGTKLALGPSASLLLDEFIYDPDKSDGKIVIRALKGAFRFISGLSQSENYVIETPVATMGVRGTIFDGYISETGEIAVLLVEGEVDVCDRQPQRQCRRLRKPGDFMHVNLRGLIFGPLKWDGTFLPGIAIATAFPFVGKRLVIDPVRRLTRKSLYSKGFVKKTLNAPKKIIRKIPKPRLKFP